MTTASRPAGSSAAARVAARAVALGHHGAAFRADQVGVAGGLAAFAGLGPEQLGEDRGLAVVEVPGRGEQRQRSPGRERAQPAERRALPAPGELAANAILHARSAFTVILSAHGDLLRISVRDASPLAGAGLTAAPLHGLWAVNALASRWGVESLGPAGKTVWVELRR